MLTDEYMSVLGSNGSIWAFGDASTIHQPKALDHADELFEAGDTNKVKAAGLQSLSAADHGSTVRVIVAC